MVRWHHQLKRHESEQTLGDSEGQGSLVYHSPWSHKELDETWVQLLGQEDPLEKGKATHSSILAWRIPGTEEPGGLQSMGSSRVRHDITFTFTFHFHALEKEMATHSGILAWRIP